MPNSQPSIFVQIPSYRDPQLIPTLVDMITNASRPDLLSIVVCWQHGEDESLRNFEDAGFLRLSSAIECCQQIHSISYLNTNIRLIDVHYLETCGCGWARSIIQQHFQNETYSLQMDSHHRFIEGWDIALTTMLESLRPLSLKPVLTGYPPPFDPDSYPESRYVGAIQMDFERFCPPGVIRFRPSPMKDWQSRQLPMRARFLSGGFVFADGLFVQEVPNDPAHFFSSEEISTAVRAYTHGYDLFHPHRPVIWHQYSRDSSIKVWDDHTPARKASGSIPLTSKERAIQSYLRTQMLFGMIDSAAGDDSFGLFGLGRERTLRQYEQFAGLSFELEAASDAVLNGIEPTESPLLERHEWEENLVCTLDVFIRVNPEVVTSFFDDISISVVIYAAEEIEVYRIELDQEDLNALRNGKVTERFLTFSTSPCEKPLEYKILAYDSLGKSRQLATSRIHDDLVEQFFFRSATPT